MRRRIAVVAVGAVASLGFMLPGAQAACPEGTILQVNLDINVNGEGQVQEICLPPSGGDAPGLPGVPELPAPPAP